MTVDTDSLFGDMPLEGGSQRWQVQVAVDAAELLACLDQAGGAPAQGPCLDGGRCDRARTVAKAVQRSH